MTLHQERLAVYQQLGDVRSRAVTLAHIARLKAQAGDVQGAMTRHEEYSGSSSNWATCARAQ